MQHEIWSAFTRDPRLPQHAGLRASDADRNVVRDVLTEAYADGRLDRDEFDARSTEVASARTLGDLPGLLDGLASTSTPDLPPTGPPGVVLLSAEQIEQRALVHWQHERRSAVVGFLSASVICWVIWLVVMPGGFPWPLFVMLGTGVNAVRAAASRAEVVERERRRLEKRQRKALGAPWQPDDPEDR